MPLNPATDYLQKYLRNLPVQWTPEGLDALVASFEYRTLNKGDYFLKAGQVCHDIGVVVSGCLRLFMIDEGDEKSLFFFFENHFCSDSRSFLTRQPAQCYIDAIEDCALYTLSHDQVQALGKRYRDVADCHRLVLEKLLISGENRIMMHVLTKAEDRYRRLLSEFGDMISRLPQKYLASYLGVTPVSLSRIRSRVAR